MDLESTDLALMGQMICETMLQLPADAAAVPGDADAPRRALTRISGAWNGLVAIDCSGASARRAASVMFGVAPAALSDDDLRDAVLEMANVIGGNVKALLAEPCRLSVPSVLEADPRQAFANMRLVAHFDVPTAGFPMSVTILRAA